MNLMNKIGQGITIRKFMEDMQVRYSQIPNTKKRFTEIYNQFPWSNEEIRSLVKPTGENFAARHALILCTDWCPDVIWNVPVLFRTMEIIGIKAEILIMEEHLETMDLFLTHEGRAQPIAVFLQEDGEFLGKWGARPAYIQKVMDDFKLVIQIKKHPAIRKI